MMSIADAPPSTRRSVIGVPLAATMAETTSRVWYAIASMTALVTWARVVPRVIPRMAPRRTGPTTASRAR